MNKLIKASMPLVLLFSLVVSALAEEKIALEEVVVTATRTEEEVDKIPANVTVITQKDIMRSTALTVPDLLRNESGLNVTDLYGSGATSRVDMRGFTYGMHTAVLIDGKKVNEIDLSGVDWNLIPLENIERIEIVRGSGSVAYGNNAMAGVINIITKKGTTPQPEAEIEGRIESYDGHEEHSSLSGASDKASYYFFLKNRYTDGYRQNGRFDAKDFRSNFSINLTDALSAEITGGYHTDLQGLPGTLSEAELRSDRRQSTKPKDNVEYEQYFIGTKLTYAQQWGEIEAGYRFNSREYVFKYFSGDSLYKPDRDTDRNDLNLKLVLKKDLGGLRNKFIAGIDYLDAAADEKALSIFMSVPSTTTTNVRKRDTDLYVEDELFLSNRISILAGYRHSESKNSYEQSPLSGSKEYNGDAYRAGIAYNYLPGAKVFANYSRGFRIPAIEELLVFDLNTFQTIISPLHPELSDSFEVGIVHPVSDRFVLRLTAFHMNIKDEIFYNSISGQNENLEKTRHEGIESGFNAVPIENVSVYGNWTYSIMTNKSGDFEGKTLPLRPRNTVNLGADVKFLANAVFSVKANWVDKQVIENDLDNTKPKLPDYLTVDTKISYKYKSATAYVGINNLFDKEYSASAGLNFLGEKRYYPAPGRNYYAGVRFNF